MPKLMVLSGSRGENDGFCICGHVIEEHIFDRVVMREHTRGLAAENQRLELCALCSCKLYADLRLAIHCALEADEKKVTFMTLHAILSI